MLFSSFTLSNLSSRRWGFSQTCAKETTLPQLSVQSFRFSSERFKLKISNGLNGAFSLWICMWGEKKNSNSRSMSWKRVKKGQALFKVTGEHDGTNENLDS